MALRGRGVGLARSALAISRCNRHPGDGCSSVVVTGRLRWIPGTHQCNSITTADDHTSHQDGNQRTDPSVAESHDLEGNNKSMFHQQGLAFGNGRRVAGNGLARGEPSPPPSVTPLTEESDSLQGIEDESLDNTHGKQNWMNYQAGLQMRASLRDFASGGHGSSGNGGGTRRELNAKRHGHKLTRNRTPMQELPLSGGKMIDDEATKEETNAIGSGKMRASPGYDDANAHPEHETHVDDVHPGIMDYSGSNSEDARDKRWKTRMVIEESADGPENGSEEIEPGRVESASLSHFELAGSAWANVHAKANLRALMKGLANDFGVTQGAKERNVSKRTFGKVLSIFTSLVLEDPNTAFPGEAGQRVQQDITKLCFDPGFRADTVMRRRPVRIAGGVNRSIDIEIAGRKASSPFATARSKLLKEVLIPRIAQLAEEHFPHEVESARIMFEATDLTNPHEWYPLARLRKRRIIYHGGIDAMDPQS